MYIGVLCIYLDREENGGATTVQEKLVENF